MKKVPISVTIDPKDKLLLEEITWLKEYIIDKSPVTYPDIITEGIHLVAKKINHKKLMDEHGHSFDNFKRKPGRKKSRTQA